MGVLEFHCKVAEGSDPLKILRNYGIGERVLSETKDFQDETVHPREVILAFLNVTFLLLSKKKKHPHKLFMNLKKVHSRVVQICGAPLDGPSEQIVWLGNSPIKGRIQNQITCSKALL